MKVGDLVTHVDSIQTGVGVVVETYTDLNSCRVIWPSWGSEAFIHFKDSLEVINESR